MKTYNTPSIVKFPNDDTYYVYSSHHLIFTSEDLINWKKYDFTSKTVQTLAPKTYKYVYDNYPGTTVNGTYWAPDVIYREDDTTHPYWMYISVSCGFAGMYSVVGLVKSPTPLFWADTDSSKVNAIEDAGVVFATKGNSNYKTNAIDANIYTDSYDGSKYYIWGSFWQGIQAESLTAEGRVKNIDYTSDTTLLNSCNKFGTSVFTQKNGAAGPEGAWMTEHGDYRYMFTSYGYLGSNYNTRVARAPLSKSFGTDMGTQLVDANGVVMGKEYTDGSTSKVTGYKLIGSYRLGSGTSTVSVLDTGGYAYYYKREAGDAHIYYGPGHNSVINIGDESFYVSHIRKDAPEGAAILQTRKMLYTEDGWPVVSPVTYAGEKEQKLPKSMLTGTYDLASVGHTKFYGTDTKINETGNFVDRNYDLPVLSSKVTLLSNGKLDNDLGTWEFDGNHTVTLKFTKDGDSSKDEFYKSGDIMKLYALYGYDKDESEPVIALTGTDQNHITQLAKKSAANVYRTTPDAIGETTPVVLTKSTGGNPELGFDGDGNILYAGDPAATVIDTDNDGVGDTVYLIAGHDQAMENDTIANPLRNYTMPDWLIYKSTDMKNWEYVGKALEEKNISWVNDAASAWASQMIKHGNKYYLYYCAETKHSTYDGKSIGVAVADNPEGPYVDKGSPLVLGSFTEPSTSNFNDIDPTVWVETVDGIEHRYLAWGNGKYYICELNDDMISVKDIDGDGSIVMHKDIKERKIKSLQSGDWFTEAPWIYRRQDSEGNYYGKYYLFFAKSWREEMAYAMADDLFGRYDYIQTIMPPTATSNTNHPSVIDFKGKTYFIYHNGALTDGFGHRRSIAIEELKFDENGYVYPLTETSIGIDGTASTIMTSDRKYLGHNAFRNPSSDESYPLSVPVTVSSAETEYNTAWEIKPAKAAPNGENADNYVSIQSVDKPGLYITVSDGTVVLTQEVGTQMGDKMTFKTVKGLDGREDSVSFESVSEPGRYLTALDKTLTLSYGSVPADASFTIGSVTTKPESAVSVAPKEAEPQPEADVSSDFNKASTGDVLTVEANVTSSKAYPGADLYIGGRSGGASYTTWAIEAGVGVDSTNALVMNSGRFTNGNRGPRVQITTPAIPNGYTVTGGFKVKLGTNGELYYNDSTSTQAKTAVPSVSTSAWADVKVTIENDSDTYTRTMYVNDVKVFTDYVDQFPVFWGIEQDSSTVVKVYFDNFYVNTTQTTE